MIEEKNKNQQINSNDVEAEKEQTTLKQPQSKTTFYVFLALAIFTSLFMFTMNVIVGGLIALALWVWYLHVLLSTTADGTLKKGRMITIGIIMTLGILIITYFLM